MIPKVEFYKLFNRLRVNHRRFILLSEPNEGSLVIGAENDSVLRLLTSLLQSQAQCILDLQEGHVVDIVDLKRIGLQVIVTNYLAELRSRFVPLNEFKDAIATEFEGAPHSEWQYQSIFFAWQSLDYDGLSNFLEKCEGL